MTKTLPKSIDETQALLAGGDYVADRSLATSLFLALAMQRPLFLEGEAGVGKTEIAKVLAAALKKPLIRLQCYEGLDTAAAVYEWLKTSAITTGVAMILLLVPARIRALARVGPLCVALSAPASTAGDRTSGPPSQ